MECTRFIYLFTCSQRHGTERQKGLDIEASLTDKLNDFDLSKFLQAEGNTEHPEAFTTPATITHISVSLTFVTGTTHQLVRCPAKVKC